MIKIKKAILPVAGFGTRFLPVTKAQPKEMLPIVDKPIIQYLVEEAVEAGIEEIIFVTGRGKRAIEDHFDYSWALEHDLAEAGKKDKLKEIREISKMANFIYIRQKGPYGNGTPVLSAASLIESEPFVFVWGDDLVKSEISFTKQMIEDYDKTGHLMIGVQKVPQKDVVRYGIVDIDKRDNRIKGIIEKPTIKQAPSKFADFGRMILNQDIIEILKKTRLGKGNELWIVDAIRDYIKAGGEFYAKEVQDGEWLTTGDPWNLLKANLEYAIDRKDLKTLLKRYLKTL